MATQTSEHMNMLAAASTTVTSVKQVPYGQEWETWWVRVRLTNVARSPAHRANGTFPAQFVTGLDEMKEYADGVVSVPTDAKVVTIWMSGQITDAASAASRAAIAATFENCTRDVLAGERAAMPEIVLGVVLNPTNAHAAGLDPDDVAAVKEYITYRFVPKNQCDLTEVVVVRAQVLDVQLVSCARRNKHHSNMMWRGYDRKAFAKGARFNRYPLINLVEELNVFLIGVAMHGTVAHLEEGEPRHIVGILGYYYNALVEFLAERAGVSFRDVDAALLSQQTAFVNIYDKENYTPAFAALLDACADADDTGLDAAIVTLVRNLVRDSTDYGFVVPGHLTDPLDVVNYLMNFTAEGSPAKAFTDSFRDMHSDAGNQRYFRDDDGCKTVPYTPETAIKPFRALGKIPTAFYKNDIPPVCHNDSAAFALFRSAIMSYVSCKHDYSIAEILATGSINEASDIVYGIPESSGAATSVDKTVGEARMNAAGIYTVAVIHDGEGDDAACVFDISKSRTCALFFQLSERNNSTLIDAAATAVGEPATDLTAYLGVHARAGSCFFKDTQAGNEDPVAVTAGKFAIISGAMTAEVQCALL